MRVEFSREERDYIVDNAETDLMLTEVGLRLVDRYKESDELLFIDVPHSDYEQFIADLREEFLWKSRRLRDPRILINLVRRLLQDFESLEPMNFC
jgi:hypothetical protein